MTPTEGLFRLGLSLSPRLAAFSVDYDLKKQFPDKAVLQVNRFQFNFPGYAAAGHCHLLTALDAPSERRLFWKPGDDTFSYHTRCEYYTIEWESQLLNLLFIETSDREVMCWIIADTHPLAESFYAAVCRWQAEIRKELLVFNDDTWEKSKKLYEAIQNADLDQLSLPGNLKETLLSDFEQFFASKELYARYGVAWKRGALFVGPPGNGKTHTIKALINRLEKPCLYVKSIGRYQPYKNLRKAFVTIRETAPCIVVLEDLDTIVNDKNRSYFLNEMDGFAANEGVLFVATTNHPEKLDPALRSRPSRFDRKFMFNSPDTQARKAYLDQWNAKLEPSMRVTESFMLALARETEGFSYASLKELTVCSIVRLVNRLSEGKTSTMEAILSEQVTALRTEKTQLREAALKKRAKKSNSDNEDDEDDEEGYDPDCEIDD